jgi:hypothetical protein
VTASDRAALLVGWLDELVYLAETENLVADAAERLELDGDTLRATVRNAVAMIARELIHSLVIRIAVLTCPYALVKPCPDRAFDDCWAFQGIPARIIDAPVAVHRSQLGIMINMLEPRSSNELKRFEWLIRDRVKHLHVCTSERCPERVVVKVSITLLHHRKVELRSV